MPLEWHAVMGSVLQTQLLWLAATLGVYFLALRVFNASRHFPLLNPLLASMLALMGLLWFSGTSYATYRHGTAFIDFLLGPATVALAVPLYEYRRLLRQMWAPLLGALVVGSLATIGSVVAVGRIMGLSRETLLSLAPKAVTTPIALGIVQSIGGSASLVVVFTMITGITGAILGLTLLRWLRVRDHAVAGFALGLGASGIGTARGFEESEEMGAFGGLAVGLNGVFTAVVLPLLVHWHVLGL